MSDGSDPGQPVSLDQLHNFGEFFFDPNIGLDISHTFEIQNTRWEEPVTLAVVSNSCSCTVAEIVNNTIAFGESAGEEKSIELVGVFYSLNLPEEIELSSPRPYMQIREQRINTEPAQHGVHNTEARASGLIVANHFNVAQVGLQVANIYLRADYN